MNLGELKTEVTNAIEESATETDHTFWTQADITDAINDAQDEMADACGFYERRVPIQLIKGVTYYDLWSYATGRQEAADDSYIFIAGVWNPQINIWLDPVSIDELDAYAQLRWEGNQGDPRRYTVRGIRHLAIHPTPNATSGYLDVWLTAAPPEMVYDTDEPGFPSDFHWGLVEYAKMELFAQDRETRKCLKAWEEYQVWQRKLDAFVANRLSDARAFVAGGSHA